MKSQINHLCKCVNSSVNIYQGMGRIFNFSTKRFDVVEKVLFFYRFIRDVIPTYVVFDTIDKRS